MARRGDDPVILTAAALGAIAGMRSMSAAALLTHELAERGSPRGANRFERLLSSEATARILALAAGGEMLADKSSLIPDRTSALPLAGRAVIGSLTAAAFATHRRQSPVVPAAIGAITAVATTFAAFHVRRYAGKKFRVPDRLLGMIEDALVLAASRGVVAALDQAD